MMKKRLKQQSETFNEPGVNKKDTSPIVYQRSKYKGIITIKDRVLTPKQQSFLNIAKDKNTKLMFVSGPAGTSKTYMAILYALQMIKNKEVSDLIYIRSAVESSDSKIGFLPGEANEKMAPYIQPLMDKLAELIPSNDISNLLSDKRINSLPINFLRGLNWNSKVLILDEAQNTSFKELTTFITRVGEFSKVLVLGDPGQSDINGKSGFVKMMNFFDDEESKQNGIQVFKFTEDDIVRSELVKFISKKLKQYYDQNQQKT